LNVRMTARAVGLLIISAVILSFMISPLRAYLGQRHQLSNLRAQTQLISQQNAKLQQSADQLRDPQYLDQLSRECLGMVNPGQISFVTVPQSGAPSPAPC
jgi:cell division protein FtsB